MKKTTITLALLFIFCYATRAQAYNPSYITSKVSEEMTFENVVINYNVTVFKDRQELLNLIQSLISAQPNGSVGQLSTKCSNIFTLQTEDCIRVWDVVYSNKKHMWRVVSTPSYNIATVGQGTIIFSRQ